MPRPNHKNCIEWIERVQESEGPEEPFLLGFGTEIRRSIRSYMRDLWLPFRSTRAVMPREWYCRRVEAFAAEISQRVNDFVNEDGKLGNELDGIHHTLGSVDLQKREPFAYVAEELLITREWGDNLWGHRRYCSGPLIKPDREIETPKPMWPQDQELITLAVRRWIAAQIQWKIEEVPRKKGSKVVPPVENAPDDAEARRAEIRAGSRTEREDSEDEGRPYGSWARSRTFKKESPPSLPTRRLISMRAASSRTTRARAAQQVEGSQPISATRSKKRKRQGPTSSLIEENSPSLPVEYPIPLRTTIPRTTKAMSTQQVNVSQPVSIAKSKKRERQGPSTMRSKAPKVSTSRSRHEDVSEQHTPTHVLDTAIDSGVALSLGRSPTEITKTVLSGPTNGDNVRYRSRVELSAENPPSIASLQSEAYSSQQNEEAVLREPSPTPSLILVCHKNLEIENEVIFVREAPILPRLVDSVVAVDARDHILSLIASPISPIATPRLSMPAPVPISEFTEPSMLTSPVLDPPGNLRGFAIPESRRPTLHPSAPQPPPCNPKFPPGSSKVPRRCSKCDHSLDELVDIMMDSGGFAQWKKNCTYCRREVGRSKPCMCHRCQSRTEIVDELSTEAASSTSHVSVPIHASVDVSTQAVPSTGLTLPPLVEQLRTMGNDGQSLNGWPPPSFLDDLTRDTNYRSMAFNGSASIADASQQVATTNKDSTPTPFNLPDLNPSDLGYHSDSDIQQENAVAGQATYARNQPIAPAYSAPAPYNINSVDTFPSSAWFAVPSPQVNPSYLPTPTLSSRSISVVSTGNSKRPTPVTPRNLTIMDDADWVIDERPELTRAMRQIQQNWGSGWRAKLQAEGIYTDSRPNEQLAKSLARLSSYERNIVTLLNSLQAFRNDLAHNNRSTKTQTDSHFGLFGAYDGWLKSMSASQFDDWRSFLSTSKKHMGRSTQ